MENMGKKASISKGLINMAAMSHTPISAGFELTARCTLRCKMCYIVSDNYTPCKEKELTAQQWIDIAREGVKLGLLYVQLTGGEAMMRSDFREIYTALHKMGLKITLNTNATLIDDDAIEFFKKYPPIKFSVSLYGASDKTYEELCGLKNGYTLVTERIEKLKKAELNVKINLTLTKYNVHDAQAICEFARDRGIPLNPMSYTFPPESSSDITTDDTRLNASDAAKVYLLCDSVTLPKEKFYDKVSALSQRALPWESVGIKSRKKSNKLQCQAASSSYWITWQGEMLPCVTLSSIKEYPLEIGLKEAWERIVKRTDEAVRFPDECVECSMRDICFACPGYFYAETGDTNTLAPNICKYIEKYVLHSREIMKGKSIYEI